MTRPRRFEDTLESWLDEGPIAAPSNLLEAAYSDIPDTYQQRRRLGAVRRFPMLARSLRFAAAAAAVVLVGVIGFALVRGLAPVGGTGGSPTIAPTDVAVVTPTDPAGASPTPESTVGFCLPEDLHAQVISWEGAAGHRIATVVMANTGPACQTLGLDRPQLVADGGSSVLINGAPPAASAVLTIDSDGTVSALVQDGNYCGPEVATGPVSVAFVLASGTGRVVAAPLSPTDLSGIPPCNGVPGSAGTIEMQPWAP